MIQRHFRNAAPGDAARCYAIESTAYSGDEAATFERIALRIAHYPQGFLVLEVKGRIVGFINSGCAHEVRMADKTFKELQGHDPAAPHVVILSVAVDPDEQGKGHAGALMRAFVERMVQRGKHSIHLMCREHHVELYRKMGYRYLAPSASDHGGLAWHEMAMELVPVGQRTA